MDRSRIKLEMLESLVADDTILDSAGTDMDRSGIKLEMPESLVTDDTIRDSAGNDLCESAPCCSGTNPGDVMRLKLEGSIPTVKQEIMDVVIKQEIEEDFNLMEEIDDKQVRGQIRNCEEHIKLEEDINWSWVNNLTGNIQMEAQPVVKNEMPKDRPQEHLVNSERINGSSNDDQTPFPGRVHQRWFPPWTSSVTSSHGGTVHNESFSLTSRGKLNQIEKKITVSKSSAHHLHSDAQPIICPVCGLGFQSKAALSTHQREHIGAKGFNAVGDKTFACEICNKSFTQGDSFYNHMMKHQNMKLFSCPDCDKVFPKESSLKVHLRIHTRERSYDISGKVFSALGDKAFACEICNMSFAQADMFHNHKMKHQKMKLFSCQDCDKVFSKESSLKAHSPIHTIGRPYQCTTCGKTFKSQQALQLHRATHIWDKPYGCTTCTKSFTTPYCLKVHQRIHTGERPYACSTCDKSFSFRQVLERHQRTHTGEKPYVCTTCDKSFGALHNFQRHQRTHTREKSYACTTCDIHFKTHQDLQNHQRTHAGEKPHASTTCD